MAEDAFNPKSGTTTGYHLFLEPEGDIRDELQDTILQLSQTYGGPIFPPHVTLLSRIAEADEQSAIEHATDAALALSPLTLTLGALASEESYYRALYSRIEEQEGLKLYHRLAAAAFEVEANPDYLAHLSLLYGNYSADMIEAARNEAALPELKTFVVDTVHLYRTEGAVSEWQKIGEFPMFG